MPKRISQTVAIDLKTSYDRYETSKNEATEMLIPIGKHSGEQLS